MGLKQSGQGGKREGGRAEGAGQVVQGVVGLREDLGFYLGWWEPWRAVGRGQDGTQVLTGVLWWPLWGGQTGG